MASRNRVPRFDLILIEVPTGAKLEEFEWPTNTVGVRTVSSIPDDWLRKRFWPMWDQLVQEATEAGSKED